MVTLSDLLRFSITWLVCAGLVFFWYWVLSRIGTF